MWYRCRPLFFHHLWCTTYIGPLLDQVSVCTVLVCAFFHRGIQERMDDMWWGLRRENFNTQWTFGKHMYEMKVRWRQPRKNV